MSEDRGSETEPDKAPEPQPERSFALVGVVFVILLAVGAMYLVNRMRHWAEMGDCAFTHAPACRELIAH